jgi:3-oxoacyl-(acyl-carrier-protein) synthase
MMNNKKNIFVNGIGIVSPQPSMVQENFPGTFTEAENNRFRSADPGFKTYIPADLNRRMGRVIKMGVSAAKICLQDAGMVLGEEPESYRSPDAIITGTGWGCLEDTGKFLTSMIKNREEFLTPTSFIQSTHNTVAGQIALLTKCHSYNFTYVHRGFSFESALLDAMMQMESGDFSDVLLGASDELTEGYLAITGRLGFWKRKTISSLQLSEDTQRGSIPGEGAAFFYLSAERNNKTYASLKGLKMFNNPWHEDETGVIIDAFLAENQLNREDIGLILAGFSGDQGSDLMYRPVIDSFDASTIVAHFKHLCGEYPTSTSFALGLASLILKTGKIPDILLLKPDDREKSREIGNILIHNNFRGMHHSLILVSNE